MTFEDIGLLRNIPNIKIYEVCDPIEFNFILKKVYKEKGLSYIRTHRKTTNMNIYNSEEDISETGSNILSKGRDVSIFASGIEVIEAIKAKDILKSKGINAEVIDIYRIKPLDEEKILRSASKTKKVITCENHSIINGLGSSICEFLSENIPTKIIRIGIKDKFGQVGEQKYLSEKYEISSDYIVKAYFNML